MSVPYAISSVSYARLSVHANSAGQAIIYLMDIVTDLVFLLLSSHMPMLKEHV
jgi:hypothetical protein